MENVNLEQPKLPVIGLTGGIGSGKSSVSNILKSYGAYIIDADDINHSIIKRGKPAYEEIRQEFGDNLLEVDLEISRKSLADVVFNNKEKLLKLVDITHKYVLQECYSLLGARQKDHGEFTMIVFDAPL